MEQLTYEQMIAVQGYVAACTNLTGPAAYAVDFIYWLDWCIHAYFFELLAATTAAFVFSYDMKRLPSMKNKKHLHVRFVSVSIISWLIYCLINQGYPAVG